MRTRTPFRLALALTLGASPCGAFAVDFVVEGPITAEAGGLGLAGQTLRMTLSYDPGVTGSASGAATLYSDFATAMTITIGANTWQWSGSPDTDFLFLHNNDVITFASGSEDRFNLFAGEFTGPTLVNGGGAGVVDPFSYNLTVILSDNVPTGNPDALSSDTALPNPAPNPAMFSNAAQPLLNAITFAWTEGDLETGTRYSVTASNLVAVTPTAPSPVPLPMPFAALCALGGALVFGARRYLGHA